MISNPCTLNDVTRCIGCEECVAACKKINGLPAEDPPPRVGHSPDRLSATRWTSVLRRPGKVKVNVRKQCRHCLEPACVSVCPVGALQKTPQGPVIYDKDICFHRERYHHAVRPAILTALLGYAAVAVGLIYDLGLPWNIWHPIIFWNPHSPLFEVAWCVMTYLAILFLEFLPVFLERTRFQGPYRTLLRLQLPLIILGISVSTLHQSSLGTLLLIMPFRLHPLWYTPHLPELFFVSAICLGLVMVIFESSVTAWLYERKPHTHMLSGLARFAAGGLAFYLAFRFYDLWHQGRLGLAFHNSFEARLFWFEMGISTIVPLVLFLIPRVRRSHTGVFIASAMGVVGFLLNRIDASGLAQVWATRTDYFPMWSEFAISLGIVSFFALIYLFIQEHFPVEKEIVDEEEKWLLRKAAHGICIDCHRREATNPEWKKPDLFRCAICHGTPVPHGKAVLEASLGAQQD